MSRQRQQIDPVGIHIDGDFPRRLRRIGKKEHSMPPGDPADLPDRLNDTDFVIRIHDRDERGGWPDRGLEGGKIDQTGPIDPQPTDLRTQALQVMTAIQYGFVFRDDGDQVIAFGSVRLEDALDRQIVGFGRTRREDDLFRLRADERRYLLPRQFHRLLRLPTLRMAATCRISEPLREIREHRRYYARVTGRRGIVIEID